MKVRFYEKYGWVNAARQSWMTTAPWEPARLSAKGGDGSVRGVNEDVDDQESDVAGLRCQVLKKFLGFEQRIVPRFRSYPLSARESRDDTR